MIRDVSLSPSFLMINTMSNYSMYDVLLVSSLIPPSHRSTLHTTRTIGSRPVPDEIAGRRARTRACGGTMTHTPHSHCAPPTLLLTPCPSHPTPRILLLLPFTRTLSARVPQSPSSLHLLLFLLSCSGSRTPSNTHPHRFSLLTSYASILFIP